MKRKPSLSIEKWQLEDACEMQPQDHQDDSSNLSYRVPIDLQEITQCAGTCPQSDEREREAEDKDGCVQKRYKALGRFLLAIICLMDTLSHKLRQVNRHEWQYTRREERYQTS